MNKLLVLFAAAAVSLSTAAGIGNRAIRTVEADDISVQQQASNSLGNAVVTLKYSSYTLGSVPVTPDDRNGIDEVSVKLNGQSEWEIIRAVP